LRAVRMVIWRVNLISRKAKNTPSLGNITPESAPQAHKEVRNELKLCA
jgi:hypothetical protein